MKKRSAFTIVELLVSIMIVGILSSLGYQQYTKAILKANAAGQISQFKSLEAAMAKYYADTGTMPTDLAYLFDSPNDTSVLTIDNSNAGLIDVFGFVDAGGASEKVKDYWGGPYIEKLAVAVDPEGDGTLTNLTIDQLGCGSTTITAPGVFVSGAKCVKAKLGGQVCVGAKIGGVNYQNVFILNKINPDMVREIFTMANAKTPSNNAQNVGDFNTSDKLGVVNPNEYLSENGCIVWRFYDSALRN